MRLSFQKQNVPLAETAALKRFFSINIVKVKMRKMYNGTIAQGLFASSMYGHLQNARVFEISIEI
jgi:hypothetical protein